MSFGAGDRPTIFFSPPKSSYEQPPTAADEYMLIDALRELYGDSGFRKNVASKLGNYVVLTESDFSSGSERYALAHFRDGHRYTIAVTTNIKELAAPLLALIALDS